MRTEHYDITVGAMVRGHVKKIISDWLTRRSIPVRITEAKSLRSSYYVITLEATEQDHKSFNHFLDAIERSFSKEG